MTRAARIEPRTPEGEVYVKDAFAALFAIEQKCEFTIEYVGGSRPPRTSRPSRCTFPVGATRSF